jgi:hypothetical protein
LHGLECDPVRSSISLLAVRLIRGSSTANDFQMHLLTARSRLGRRRHRGIVFRKHFSRWTTDPPSTRRRWLTARVDPVNRVPLLTRDKESSRPEIRGPDRNLGGSAALFFPGTGLSPLARESASHCGTGGKSENAGSSRSRRFLLTRRSRNSATGRKAPRLGLEPGTWRFTDSQKSAINY